ncbi:hypothetical protein MMC13_001277 [Lambiella insularis]|nr:hypothetical protein [Lambiella insularis]
MINDEYDLDVFSSRNGQDQAQSLLPSNTKSRISASYHNAILVLLKSCGRFVWYRLSIFSLLRRRRQTPRHKFQVLLWLAIIPICWALLFFGIFTPSRYIGYPSWYPYRGLSAGVEGSANPSDEKIFIAANIVDRDLILGRWGEAVKELVYILGRQNVFLSIYENDSGPGPKAALKELRDEVKCNASIVTTSLPLDMIPTIEPFFVDRPVRKGITYLATVRNLALLPLTYAYNPTPNSQDAYKTSTSTPDYHEVPLHPSKYSRILFLNDVVFSPEDAAHLIFDTNKGDYSAACALDFINPVKFYDTFALRNTRGDGIGLPLYPFFTPGPSQSALLSGSDSVPVKSCWSGMIAFNASVFTRDSSTTQSPVRFRSEQKEPMIESSECCLIHADIADAAHTFVNPFIRVAYGPGTFYWLNSAKRFEKMWFLPHMFLSWIVGMPWNNPRRDEIEGEIVQEIDYDGHSLQRIAAKGGFCGIRGLFVIEARAEGVRTTSKWPLPPQ